MKSVYTTARHVPRSLAALVQELELRQPRIVTAELLRDVIGRTGSHLDTRQAADRLTRAGWLVPLRTRHAWEFAPAARAAAVGSGDPWVELRALLHHRPDAPVAIAFASAVWELGHAMHPPNRRSYAHRPGWRPPRALRGAQATAFEWRLPTVDRDGLPVWQAATIIVAIASSPARQHNWANADRWLPETMHAAGLDDVMTEADLRSTAALARLGYLARWSQRHDIADAVKRLLPADHGVTYLGPRDGQGTWNPEWRVYDAYLPQR